MNQAQTIAKDKNLTSIFPKISQHQEQLNIEAEKWVNLADKYKKVRKRLETIKLKEHISSAL